MAGAQALLYLPATALCELPGIAPYLAWSPWPRACRPVEACKCRVNAHRAHWPPLPHLPHGAASRGRDIKSRNTRGRVSGFSQVCGRRPISTAVAGNSCSPIRTGTGVEKPASPPVKSLCDYYWLSHFTKPRLCPLRKQRNANHIVIFGDLSF